MPKITASGPSNVHEDPVSVWVQEPIPVVADPEPVADTWETPTGAQDAPQTPPEPAQDVWPDVPAPVEPTPAQPAPEPAQSPEPQPAQPPTEAPPVPQVG